MTTETILTDEEIITLGRRVGAIEQAVLQSGQAQKWKQDSERYQWLKKQFRVMSLDMGGNHAWILRGPLRDGRTIDEVCDKSMEQQT